MSQLVHLSIFAWSFSGIGAWLMFKNRAALRTRTKLVGAPRVRICDAPGKRHACVVQGSANALEQGTVNSPISEQAVLWYRVTVEEYHNESYVTRFTAVEGCDFELDDASGATAQITATGNALLGAQVTLVLERRELAKSSLLNAAPEAVTRYLADRGVPTRSTLGFRKDLRIYEETIRVGDVVCVLGHANVEDSAVRTEAQGYRSTAKRSFGFRADADLVVATGTRQSLLDAVAGPFYQGAAICAGSAVVAVVALVATLLSLR